MTRIVAALSIRRWSCRTRTLRRFDFTLDLTMDAVEGVVELGTRALAEIREARRAGDYPEDRPRNRSDG